MLSVYQHWDKLKVCAVGKSYSPDFYNYIENKNAREAMQRIARETEEDYQKLISLLESFDVKVIRPVLSDDYRDYVEYDGRIAPPPMTPRDYTIMLGDTFIVSSTSAWVDRQLYWDKLRGDSWPVNFPTTEDQYNSLAQRTRIV